MTRTMPNWVQNEDDESIDRLRREVAAIANFPAFSYRVLEDTGMMFAEGILELASGNAYMLRIYFPDNYPNSPPYSIIKEQSVFEAYVQNKIPCTNGINMNGVQIIPYLYPVEEQSEITGISMFYLTARWLSAYEGWIRTGQFVHQACVHFDGKQFHVYSP